MQSRANAAHRRFPTGTGQVLPLLFHSAASARQSSLGRKTVSCSNMASLGKPKIVSIGRDRRLDRRYPLDLELRWRVIHRCRVLREGEGRTLNLSIGGVLFDATCCLSVGMSVELSISWPVLLHNVTPIRLVVSGSVVRTEGTRAGIKIITREFRTLGGGQESRIVLLRKPRPLGHGLSVQ